jgi:hypothetical protein
MFMQFNSKTSKASFYHFQYFKEGRRMKKVIGLFLAAVVLFCLPGAALASNDAVLAGAETDAAMSPMTAYIGYADCTINISSNGYASMEAVTDCYSPVNKIRMAEYLQRNVSGSWQTVASWSQYYYSDTASWAKGYYVSSGYQYRLLCYYYCYYDPTLLEGISRTDTDTY